mmetsp:Transcript_76027/g.119740  ORF Transcript_76027/g.119740 Transcript_76027/m.119740 type:complete len:592 (+) Transcript_76027:98-1873(+)
MQASPAVAAPLQKQRSYSQAVEDLLHWPIRWWGSCEASHEETDLYVYRQDLLGSRQTTAGYQAALPGGPKDRTIARYVANQKECTLGEILHRGDLLYVSSQDEIVEVFLSVHAGGFSIETIPQRFFRGDMTDEEINAEVQILAAFSFSPFSIISSAQLAGFQAPSTQTWAPFKLTVVRAEGDRQYVFISTGKDSEDERSRWIEALASGIMRVTGSLFPPYSMEVRPLPLVPSTETRIMAGYLLRCETSDSVALLYGELHAYFGGEAKLALYKDEWCDQKVSFLTLTQNMDVHSCKGAQCSIFALDGHLYAARTQEERLIWLRALGNIKVKLLYIAPDPTLEEIDGFRDAILERTQDMEQKEVSKLQQQRLPMLPLLPARPRMAPKSLRGDDLSPEPVDELSDTQSRSNSRVGGFPNATEEHVGAVRLAAVVDLMDMSECREFLKPFDPRDPTTIDLDTLEWVDDAPVAVTPSASLHSIPEADNVPVKAPPTTPARRSPQTQDASSPPSSGTSRSRAGDNAMPDPTRAHWSPLPSSPNGYGRLMTHCVPERADICRRQCVREGGPASTVQSYPDLHTLAEASRDRENDFVFV